MKSINKTEAMNKVKEKAKKDFQDDYMTQNFVAEEQSKAFDFLNSIEIKSQEELNVMKNALKDFSNDFMTAKFVYEEQMKAKNKQGKTKTLSFKKVAFLFWVIKLFLHLTYTV